MNAYLAKARFPEPKSLAPNSEIITSLVAAYRKADADFLAAQVAGGDVSFAYARIIGQLQGVIGGAAIDLGFRGDIRA